MRKIIHVDMDAFYASVEQRDKPELRGKPIAIGSSGRRGVISTASYEARKYGVRSGMPGFIAKEKCPDLIFVSHNFDKYIAVNKQLKEIFAKYTDLIEPLSLDEAFLDVTENKLNIPSAVYIANEIKKEIFAKTGLTASAGISFNKFLAKVASDYRKPNGITLIDQEHADRFIEKLAIEKFFGIGKKTAQKMHKNGIYTGSDLRKLSLEEIVENFGKVGRFYYDIVWNKDQRPVVSSRQRKSIGAERTLLKDVVEKTEIKEIISKICLQTSKRAQNKDKKGKTITLKLKFNNFKQITRSKTLKEATNDSHVLEDTCFKLLKNLNDLLPIRLIGVTISNLVDKSEQNKVHKK